MAFRALEARDAADPDRYAAGVLKALNDGDAHQLASQLSDAELELYHIDRETAEGILRHYYFSIEPPGTQYSVLGKEANGPANTVFELMVAGDPSPFNLMVEPLSGRQQSPQLLTELVFQAGMARCYPAAAGKTKSERKLRALALFAHQERPKLEKLGMPGLVRSPNEGFITWDKYSSMMDERVRGLGTDGH